MANIVEIIVRAEDEASRVFKDLVGESKKAEKEVGRAMEATGRQIEQVGGIATRAGATLTKSITVPLTGAATAATYLGTNFDAEMKKVVTLVGVAQKQVDQWSDDLLRMAPELGKAPQELAEALFVVTSAGERGAAALDILRSAAMASASGLGETKEIARAVTAAMQAYKAQGLDAATATDILVGTVREGNLEASALAGSLGRVMGIAAQVGISFADLGGFVATFTRLGVSAEEAVTALRGVIAGLIKPTSETEKAFAAMGTSAAQVRAEIRERGLAQTLVAMMQATEGNEEAIAALIPNVRALAGVLGTAGAQSDQFVQIQSNVRGSLGLNQQAFDDTAATAKHAFSELVAGAKVIAIEFNKVLGPVVMDFVDRVLKPMMDMVLRAVQRFGEWDPVLQKVALAAAGVAAALGPVLMAVGSLISMVGATVASLGVLATAFGAGGAAAGTLGAGLAAAGTFLTSLLAPVAAVVAVVGALAAGFVAAWRSSEEFRGKVQTAMAGVKEAIGPTMQEARATVEAVLQRIRDAWAKWGDEIMAVVEPIMTLIVDVIGNALEVVAHTVRLVLAAIRGDWDGVWNALVGILSAVWDVIVSLVENGVKALWNVLVGGVKAIGAALKEAAQDLVAPFKWVYDKVVGNSIVPDMVDAVSTEFVRMETNAVGSAQSMAARTEVEFREMARVSVEQTALIRSEMRAFGSEIEGAVQQQVSNAMTGIANKVRDATSVITGSLDRTGRFTEQTAAQWDFVKKAAGAFGLQVGETATKVDEANTSTTQFNATLGGTTSAASSAAKEIANVVAQLERQFETLGMTKVELIEYELRTKGATAAQIEKAKALQISIEGYDRVQERIDKAREAAEKEREEAEKYIETLRQKADELAGVTAAEREYQAAMEGATPAQRQQIDLLREGVRVASESADALDALVERNQEQWDAQAKAAEAATERVQTRLKEMVTSHLPEWAQGWEQHWQFAKDIMTIWEGDINGILKNLLGSFGGWLGSLLDMFKGGFGGILDLGKSLFGKLGGIFDGGLGGILDGVGGFLGKVGGFFDKGFGGVIGKATGFVKDFGSKLLGGLGLGEGVFGSVAKFMGGPWGAAIMTGLDLLGIDMNKAIGKIADVAMKGLGAVGNAIGKAGGAILDGLGGLASGIADAFGNTNFESAQIADPKIRQMLMDQFGYTAAELERMAKERPELLRRRIGELDFGGGPSVHVASESLQRARDQGLIGYDPRTDPTSSQYDPGFANALRGRGGSGVTRVSSATTISDADRFRYGGGAGSGYDTASITILLDNDVIARRQREPLRRDLHVYGAVN